MTNGQDELRVVSASREIAAAPERIFELIADPFLQPRWDGNDNLAEAAEGQRVRRAGEVFTMTLTRGGVRENHVTEFEEGRRIAWTPAEPGEAPARAPVALGAIAGQALRARQVTCTYDWTRLTDANRLPRARATTADKLLASIDRLAALAEKSAELSPLVMCKLQRGARGPHHAPMLGFRSRTFATRRA